MGGGEGVMGRRVEGNRGDEEELVESMPFPLTLEYH